MFDRLFQHFGIGARIGQTLHTAKSIGRQAVEGGLGIIIDEHIHGFIPPAAENVAALSGPVPAPLLYISCHVIGPVRIDSAEAAHAFRTVACKIAELHTVREDADISRVIPVIDGGKTLACEFCVSRGFVTTNSTDRKIILPLRIIPQFPSGGSRSARPIAEFIHSFVPGQSAPIFHERLFPVLALSVPSAVYEFLELAIRDFVLVHEVIGQVDGFCASPLEMATEHSHHSGRKAALRIQRKVDYAVWTGSRSPRGITSLRDLPSQISERETDVIERGFTEALPLAIQVRIALHEHVCPRW